MGVPLKLAAAAAAAAAIGSNLLDSPSVLSLIRSGVCVVGRGAGLYMCESGVNVGAAGGPVEADGGGTLSWSSSLMSVD